TPARAAAAGELPVAWVRAKHYRRSNTARGTKMRRMPASKVRSFSRPLLQLALACFTLLSCSAASPAEPQAAAPQESGSNEIRSALVRGDWTGARRLLDARVSAEPDKADAWLYLTGVACELQGEAAPALEAFSAV